MWVEYSKSQPTDDKPSMKWTSHATESNSIFKALNHIAGITEPRITKFLTQVGYIKCYQKDNTTP